MALTATPRARYNADGEFLQVLQVTADNAYPTGGYPLPPALFNFVGFAPSSDAIGPNIVAWANVTVQAAHQLNPSPVINPANGNLQFFVPTTGVEVGNGDR